MEAFVRVSAELQSERRRSYELQREVDRTRAELHSAKHQANQAWAAKTATEKQRDAYKAALKNGGRK